MRWVRIDEVEFHTAWHSLMALGVGHGLHALPWREMRPGAHAARAALFMVLAQIEAGVGCPLSMTYSAVPALRLQPELAARLLANKIAALDENSPAEIVTANIGCQTHLQGATSLPVRHWIELVDEITG